MLNLEENVTFEINKLTFKHIKCIFINTFMFKSIFDDVKEYILIEKIADSNVS